MAAMPASQGPSPYSPPPKPWRPYENQWTETPFLRFPATWYRIRWTMKYPLQWRIALLGGRFTVGELFMTLAVLGAAAGAMADTWQETEAEGAVTRSGNYASIPMFLTVVLATRNSIWTFLFGLPYERQLYWHALVAYVSVGTGLYHGLTAWYYNGPLPEDRVLLQEATTSHPATRHQLAEYAGDWRMDIEDEYFYTGWGLQGAMTILLLSSALPHLRRWAYQPWRVLHVVCALLTVIFAFLHFASLMGIGVAAWALDLVIRYYWMAGFKYPHSVQAQVVAPGVVRLAWPKKGFHYHGGQYVHLYLPSLSFMEWHPFSIASHPSQDTVYVYVRALGDWTGRLHDMVAQQPGKALELRCFIEGPYGSVGCDIYGARHTMFMLVSGGVGMAPMQSVANDLISQARRGRRLDSLWFVWSVREKELVQGLLDLQLPGQEGKQQQQQGAQGQGQGQGNVVSIVASGSAQAPGMPPYSAAMPPRELELQTAGSMAGAAGSGVQLLGGTFRDLEAGPIYVAPLASTTLAPVTADIRTDIYLTKPSPQDAAIRLSPATEACLRPGRPDLPKLFDDMARMALAKQPENPRVAVLVCGPAAMAAEVRRLCSSGLCSGDVDRVAFEFHEELFDM